MTLHGMAFLPIWHDITEGHEDEFNEWHNVEHIPERVLTPGIAVGRRYVEAEGQPYKYFTLYEADSIDVFESDGYFATGNARTEWTKKVHVYFENFVRSPCRTIMTRGNSIGGVLATVRIRFTAPGSNPHSPGDAFGLAVRDIVDDLFAEKFVTGVHAGAKATIQRKPLSQESLSLRPGAVDFDAVLMIESIGREQMEKILETVALRLRREETVIASFVSGIYTLQFMKYA